MEQQEFERSFISSSEICRMMSITRHKLSELVKNGELPTQPIMVGNKNIRVFPRTPELENFIKNWATWRNNG
jgi:hypothetical protein